MAVVNEAIPKNIEEISTQENQDLEKVKELQKIDELERIYQNESLAGEAAESKTNIQCIVDKIEEYKDDRKFYQLSQATQHALEEISQHQKQFKNAPLGDRLFDSVKAGIKAYVCSLETIQKTSKKLSDIDKFSPNSPIPDLYRWSENLEKFADELENNLPIFPSGAFDLLERVCIEIILKARQKPDKEGKRRELTRRLRFAAGFILNLVESEREKAIQEDEELLHEIELASQEVAQLIDEKDG